MSLIISTMLKLWLSFVSSEPLAQSYSQLRSQKKHYPPTIKTCWQDTGFIKPEMLATVNGWWRMVVSFACPHMESLMIELSAFSHNLKENIPSFIIVLAATANLRRVSHLFAVKDRNNTFPSQKGLKGQSKGSHYHCTITKPQTFPGRLRELTVDFALV